MQGILKTATMTKADNVLRNHHKTRSPTSIWVRGYLIRCEGVVAGSILVNFRFSISMVNAEGNDLVQLFS